MALTKSGEVWSFGDGDCGRLGHGDAFSTDNATFPRRVVLPLPVLRVAAGDAFALALLRNGEVFSWGDNSMGQLGVGGRKSLLSDEPNCTPRGVKGLAFRGGDSIGGIGGNDGGRGTLLLRQSSGDESTKAVYIAAGATHAAAVTKGGHVLTWGANAHGQLGFPPSAEDSDFEDDDLDSEESEGGTATEGESTSESDEYDEYADFGTSSTRACQRYTKKAKGTAATGPLCSTRPKVVEDLAQHGDDVTVVAVACGPS